MAFLQAKDGPHVGQRYEVLESPFVLGRHPDCHVVIDAGAVSRHHAQLLRDGGSFLIEDMQSRNGTYLNDELVSGRRTLSSGDELRVCDVAFVFYQDEPAHPADTATDDSSMGAVLIDDERPGNSTIMSKLDVSASSTNLSLTTSPELRLDALLKITQSLGRAVALDEVLPQVLDSLFKIFVQADRGFIVLRTDDGKLAPRWTSVRRRDAEESLRLSRTIVNHVIERREAILSADVTSDDRFSMAESVADFRIRSMMCAPLLDSGGEAFGVIQIDTLSQGQRFRKEDLEVLASVASQAAIAIDNAQLHEQALQQRAIERDLQLAHEVQRGFLPEHPPSIAGYEFYDFYQPAHQVGGDYFDYMLLGDGRTAVIVADVVGHGVAAALLMAKLSAETKYCLATGSDPAAAVTHLNERLCQMLVERFVTMVLVVLDPREHRAVVVNAGHMAPILRREAGRVDPVGEEKVGLPLGVAPDVTYGQCGVSLESGESLFLFTDGVHESMNDADEQFGLERVRELVAAADNAAPPAIGRRVVEAVAVHMRSAAQYDDMCIVCFGRSE